MKKLNDIVILSWMYKIDFASADDREIFAFIRSNPNTDVDTISNYMHKRKDSVQRNLDRMIAKSQLVENRHRLCINDDLEPQDLSKGFDLISAKKPKKATLNEMRDAVKGQIETFVMHRCGNNQELLDLLMNYLTIVGTSQKSLNYYTWEHKLNDLDDVCHTVEDKIQSVKEALSATPVYQRFYAPKNKSKNSTELYSFAADDDKDWSQMPYNEGRVI